MDEFQRCGRVIVLPDVEALRIERATTAGLADPVGALARTAQKAVNFARASRVMIAHLTTVIGAVRPDLIHMNNSVVTGIEWPIAARLCRGRSVAHQRGFVPPPPYVGLFDQIICISGAIRDDLIARAPGIAGRTVRV